MQLQFYQVRYFLALARTLNFTRAAEQCNVTQPALTKAVQKLEQELGGALIHRERHLTQLTELGKMILPTLEKIFAAAEAVEVRTHPGVEAKILNRRDARCVVQKHRHVRFFPGRDNPLEFVAQIGGVDHDSRWPDGGFHLFG